MRDLTGAYQTAIAGDRLKIALFYEGEFTTGTLRLWTGVGPLDWNGHTWTGAGHMLALTTIQETTDVRATGLTATLSGLPVSLLSAVLLNARRGYAGTVWLGLFDAAGALIADPAVAFKGRLDVPSIDADESTCTISVSYESRLIDLERARDRRYTNEDQAIDYPLDLGFEYVPSIQNARINWGIAGAAPVFTRP